MRQALRNGRRSMNARFARWFFLVPSAPVRMPTANPEDTLLVEPNSRGGWSLRFEGEPLLKQIGNYATPGAAERIARMNCTHVRVVEAAA